MNPFASRGPLATRAKMAPQSVVFVMHSGLQVVSQCASKYASRECLQLRRRALRNICPPSSHPGITARPPQAAARSKGDIPALVCLHFVRPAGVRVAFRFLFCCCVHRPGHSPCVVIVLKQNMATKPGHLRASHDMAFHSCLSIMSRLTSASSCRLRQLH